MLVNKGLFAELQVLEDLEEGPEILRRLVVFLFLEGVAAELAQVLQIGLRVGAGDLAQDLFVFEQAHAQALKAMELGILGSRFAAQHGQSCANRGVVLAAQQLSKVLNLAAASTVSGDFLALANGCQNVFGQVDPLELAQGEFYQLDAEVAQLVHGLFLLGFRGAFVRIDEIVVLHGLDAMGGNNGLL